MIQLACGHEVTDKIVQTRTVPQWQEVEVPFLIFFKRKEYQLLPTEVAYDDVNCAKCGTLQRIV